MLFQRKLRNQNYQARERQVWLIQYFPKGWSTETSWCLKHCTQRKKAHPCMHLYHALLWYFSSAAEQLLSALPNCTSLLAPTHFKGDSCLSKERHTKAQNSQESKILKIIKKKMLFCVCVTKFFGLYSVAADLKQVDPLHKKGMLFH